MSLLERLRHNSGLKLLSIVTAFVIWGTVHNQTNPLETRSLSVRVAPVKMPPELAVVSIDPTQVMVTLAGRSSAFAELEFSNFKLGVDLSHGKVGSQTMPLQSENLPKGLEVQRLARTTARVELDTVVTANRPVFVETRGHAADGFAAQGWQVRPNEVEVSGPSAVVQRISRVVAELDISGRTTTFESQVGLVARDASNLQVAEVALKPGQVAVTVPIRQVNSRTVSLVPVLSNPAEGYEVATVNATPTVVTLTGNAETLSRLESISTSTVDISRLTGRNTYAVSLQIPAGLTVVGSRTARVSVSVRSGRSYTGGRSTAPRESESEGQPTPAATKPREESLPAERAVKSGAASSREGEGSESAKPESDSEAHPRSSGLRNGSGARSSRSRQPTTNPAPADGS